MVTVGSGRGRGAMRGERGSLDVGMVVEGAAGASVDGERLVVAAVGVPDVDGGAGPGVVAVDVEVEPAPGIEDVPGVRPVLRGQAGHPELPGSGLAGELDNLVAGDAVGGQALVAVGIHQLIGVGGAGGD